MNITRNLRSWSLGGDAHAACAAEDDAAADRRIFETLLERFSDAAVDSSEMEITVGERIVTLTGETRTLSDAARAQRIAAQIRGVMHVECELRSVGRVPLPGLSHPWRNDLPAQRAATDGLPVRYANRPLPSPLNVVVRAASPSSASNGT